MEGNVLNPKVLVNRISSVEQKQNKCPRNSIDRSFNKQHQQQKWRVWNPEHSSFKNQQPQNKRPRISIDGSINKQLQQSKRPSNTKHSNCFNKLRQNKRPRTSIDSRFKKQQQLKWRPWKLNNRSFKKLLQRQNKHYHLKFVNRVFR